MREEDTDHGWHTAYRLNISGPDAALFTGTIGFQCKRKQLMAATRFPEINSIRKACKSQSFEIPNGHILIKALRDEMYNGKKRLDSSQITSDGNKLLSSLIYNQALRHSNLKMVITSIPNIESYSTGRLLKYMYDNGILLDTITSSEAVQNIQMYDIGVSPKNSSGYLPDGHDFIAGGFVNHNSQGSTLDSALVDIGSSTFEFGQAYVALSRVRALDGLYVWKMDPRKIRAHPAVVDFYDRIGSGATDPTMTGPAEEPAQTPPSAHVATDEDDPTPPAPWTTDGLPPAWDAIVTPFLASRAGIRLREQVTARAAIQSIAPQPDDVFAALRACPDPAAVRVVILGQDPYHTPGMAHGLAFSVRPTVTKLPPSLQNIFKELTTDLTLPPESKPTNGCLLRWATQGVLLLNDILTVTLGAAQSHAGLGWEELTAQLLAAVLQTAPHVVIMAWGNPAQKKLDHPTVRPLLTRHTVLKAVHPSPLSAHRGFFGSRPFSAANAALSAHGQAPIIWA